MSNVYKFTWRKNRNRKKIKQTIFKLLKLDRSDTCYVIFELSSEQGIDLFCLFVLLLMSMDLCRLNHQSLFLTSVYLSNSGVVFNQVVNLIPGTFCAAFRKSLWLSPTVFACVWGLLLRCEHECEWAFVCPYDELATGKNHLMMLSSIRLSVKRFHEMCRLL